MTVIGEVQKRSPHFTHHSSLIMYDIQISAVIPTYNRGPLIGRALESVLRQTKLPAEIIVIDDGSTDDTCMQVAEFGDQVRYLYQENSGSAAARHHGISAASYPWVALLDSDDRWLERHLERMAQAIQATGGVARFYFADTIRSARDHGRRLWDSLLHVAIDRRLISGQKDYVKFIVLGRSRTGSNFLLSALNGHKQVMTFSELFRNNVINWESHLGWMFNAARDVYPNAPIRLLNFQTVWCASHMQLATLGEFRQVETKPMWLQVIHGQNVLNRTGYRMRVPMRSLHGDFTLNYTPNVDNENLGLLRLERGATKVLQIARKLMRRVPVWR